MLVANQRSEDASLIDLSTDSVRYVPVGVGPHEAVISLSGRTGGMTAYVLGSLPGNELAMIDVKTGAVRQKISLGE